MFLETLITEINELISSTKNLYYKNLAKKLNNLLLKAKTYWSIVKTFYNEKKNPNKADIFNKFFAEQCTPWKNSNILPANQMLLTQSRLNSINFKEDEILKIIGALNIHKAHSHDDISIRMIKICDKSFLKALILLFEN